MTSATPQPLQANLRRYLQLINRFLRPSWKSLLVMTLASLASTTLLSLRFLALTPALETVVANERPPASGLSDLTLNNLGPTLIQLMGVDSGDRYQAVVMAAVVFISFHLFAAVFDLIGYSLLLVIRNRVRIDMTVWLHRHLIGLPLSHFLRSSTGDLTSRTVNDVNTTAMALDAITKSLLQTGFQIALYLFIMMRTDYKLTLMIIVMGLTYVAVARILGPIVFSRGKMVQEQTGVMQQSVMESYQGIRLIKSFSAERFDLERIRGVITRVGGVFTRCRMIMHLETPVRMVLDGLVVGLLVIATYRYAIEGNQLELSAFAIFMGLAMQLVNPISQLSSKFIQLNSMMGGASRIHEIMSIEGDLRDGTRKIAPFGDRIEFSGVSFEYDAGNPVLQDLNLVIPKGKTLAVVGPSGSGKSTLTDLLLRLQDPSTGVVTYDGVDIREFFQRGYRRKFGVVGQESLLMNGSVGYNIAFGREVDEERLWNAARVANAEDFIRSFPEGMDTEVGDRGTRLSGGQRQRIAIARAVYAEPEILVLDEATSSLDAESERDVQTAIGQVTSSMTSIIVAHRLSTILHADQILVLDAGRVAAIGAHDELLASSPLYQRLYHLQFSDADRRASS